MGGVGRNAIGFSRSRSHCENQYPCSLIKIISITLLRIIPISKQCYTLKAVCGFERMESDKCGPDSQERRLNDLETGFGEPT